VTEAIWRWSSLIPPMTLETPFEFITRILRRDSSKTLQETKRKKELIPFMTPQLNTWV
jgi:hypothetical protein